MRDSLTVSLIQTATHWHDPAANRDLFDDWFTGLPADSELVLLPEMFSTGFTMSSREVAEVMGGPTTRWMQQRAVELGRVLCGSVVIRDGDRYVNRFCWATPDGEIQHYDKRHRFRMAGEHEHYDAGGARIVFELDGWRVCPMVCYDLRFPVWFRNRGDYDLLLCVANWPAVRRDAWNALLRARAIENQAYVAAVNVVGDDGNDVAYVGDSSVYGPEGETLVAPSGAPGIFSHTLDKAALDDYRAAFPAWQDADRFSLTGSEGD